MLRRSFLRTSLLSVVAVGVLASLSALAGDHACNSCPKCSHKVCQGSPETKKEKKTCYGFDCKDVCIPGIRWPWQSCCEPSCGKVRTVKVLKKFEYECEHCGTKWSVVGCEPCK